MRNYSYNEAAFEKMAQAVKLAAMVDELVKIACNTKEAALLGDFVDYFTPEHEEMLKQAFGAGIMNALRGAGGAIAGGAKQVGGAIAGAGQKAMGAIQNMGAGGAAMRMQQAGAQHQQLTNMMAPSRLNAAPAAAKPLGSGLNSPQAYAAHAPPIATKDPQISFNVGGRRVGNAAFNQAQSRRTPYNPQQVQQGLMQQDLARSYADLMASQPRPVPAGQPRYNPMDVANARAGAIPAIQHPLASRVPGMAPAAPAFQPPPAPRPAMA